MKKLFFLLVLCLSIGTLLSQQQAEIKLNKTSIHPRYREWVNLSGGKDVTVNPQALLFPAAEGKDVSYQVYLSQDANFPTEKTILSEHIPWAMFSPHDALAEGKWYWKYDTYTSGQKQSTSDIFSFNVPKNVRKFVTPSTNDFLKKVVSANHPRLYVRKNELASFREANTDNEETKNILRRANKQLSAPLPEEAPTRPRDTTGMSAYEQQIMMRYMYHKFGDKVKEPIKDLSMAYFLTGKEEYIKTAIKQAVHLSKMDMRGHATSEDFNNASVMMAMAVAYDSGYDFLTESDKAQLKNAIQTRGNYFFKQYTNEFETHSMDNHVWQHTLRRFLFTSISMVGEISEASDWLKYCYEVWCSRFPILGADDGGWHDGSSYFQVNFESFIYIPFFLSKITEVDFFDMPYYENLPLFLIYSFPKDSYSTGFGDNMEKMRAPTKNYLAFADALARETGSGYAHWYADQLMKGNKSELYKSTNFTIYRLLSNMQQKPVVKPTPPDKLPQAMLFRDAGFALMHNQVGNAPEDVMITFMSVPFGATGHAHAAHNGFTINVGGKQMFGATGYYSNFNDPHTLMHYRTRGHNTILVNDLTQVIGENGYGWIARFADTKDFTYALGDATHAYDMMRTPFWIDRMEKSGVAYTAENGFGDPKVKRFRRHFVFLRPSTIVIYDDLEAAQPSKWTWLLHSYQKINSGTKLNTVFGENEVAKSKVEIFSSSTITSKIHDQFFSPAINWKKHAKVTDLETQLTTVDEYTNQWHAEFTPEKRSEKCRFLTVIQLKFNDNKMDFEPVKVKNGSFKIDGWSVKAELNENKPAKLEVKKGRNQSIVYPAKANYNSTLIVADGQKKELIDELPDAAK